MGGVRISVVADVHGNYDALARVAETADRLIVLGDLLDYIDYHDPRRGIVGEMFGADNAARFAALRVRGAFSELREFNRMLWGSMADPHGTLSAIVRERYRRVLASIPAGTIVTLGNVDVAAEWEAVAGPAMPYRDGEIVTVDGLDFAFVAGGAYRGAPVPPMLPVQLDEAGAVPAQRPYPWRPLMRPYADYSAVVDALPPADVLCSHIPPDNALLRYDTVPGRLEMCGPGLVEYIERVQPLLALSGHVHQPLRARTRLGMTECRNVGHFQRRERAVVLDTEQLHEARAARRGGEVR